MSPAERTLCGSDQRRGFMPILEVALDPATVIEMVLDG
jgi:hypothetical protein